MGVGDVMEEAANGDKTAKSLFKNRNPLACDPMSSQTKGESQNIQFTATEPLFKSTVN